ncbi:kynureninase [Spongiactinospora sp. TRM90649]|uniref:kynureninase n=1 Tax=Spongiactinospora sp. TRM90649 TaxID=3031114 RepID=UPI0023F6F3C5|nr:kynureninase [Spongiactinospora sp. TRM90649]MDF5754234.1 kynureninase [Spongiactinospora sp. TRM90649]
MNENMNERFALAADAADPCDRAGFLIPPAPSGQAPYPETAYFAGNSLGLQPRNAAEAVRAELDEWAGRAVEGWFTAERPWARYPGLLRADAAALTGALPEEVVVMNSLTINLHLMMATFYRPAVDRTRIVIEDTAFPSDAYAVAGQASWHGLDPAATVVRLAAGDVPAYLAEHGHRVALVLLGGINYLTGELLDIPGITAAGHAAGCVVGWDLAHAAGNVPLRLHDWNVDFAVWCSYKYLNGGPGAPGGCFVHRAHLDDPSLPRLAGWWGTDERVRFEMRPELDHVASADAWQVSTPPILGLAALRVSLAAMAGTGITALRARSLRLTGYLESLLGPLSGPVELITPAAPARRGAQLSIRVTGGDAAALAERLHLRHAVLADVRRPDVIRFAPAPMYSTYHDCWRAATALATELNRDDLLHPSTL